MKLPELFSCIYFGSPKRWGGLPAAAKKRAAIKIIVFTVTILVCVIAGIIFLRSRVVIPGSIMLAGAVVFAWLLGSDLRSMEPEE